MKNIIKKPIFWVIVLDAVIALGGIFISNISRLVSSFSGECWLKRFGLLCPSCGGTRCVYNFFKGNFAEAFEFNQFIFILIIYALVLVVFLNLRFVFGANFAKKPISFMINPYTAIALAVIYLIFGIMRNVLLFI